MEKEYIHGKMEEDMREIINLIKSMGSEYINGLMVDNIRGYGDLASNMVMEDTQQEMVNK
jgi:hypothetical protein